MPAFGDGWVGGDGRCRGVRVGARGYGWVQGGMGGEGGSRGVEGGQARYPGIIAWPVVPLARHIKRSAVRRVKVAVGIFPPPLPQLWCVRAGGPGPWFEGHNEREAAVRRSAPHADRCNGPQERWHKTGTACLPASQPPPGCPLCTASGGLGPRSTRAPAARWSGYCAERAAALAPRAGPPTRRQGWRRRRPRRPRCPGRNPGPRCRRPRLCRAPTGARSTSPQLLRRRCPGWPRRAPRPSPRPRPCRRKQRVPTSAGFAGPLMQMAFTITCK